MPESLRIRTMLPGDLPLGMRLRQEAGWNQTEADWQRFFRLSPRGCFLAEWDGVPVGTSAGFLFDPVGWIAMVLVDGEFRRRGIGTELVLHAITYLERLGAKQIRLDATSQGRPVYERLGFMGEYQLARMKGRAGTIGIGEVPVEAAGEEDLDAIAELDLQVTATPRRRLLEALREDEPERTWVVRHGAELAGYVFCRSGSNACQIGPAAVSPALGDADAAQVGNALLDRAFSELAGQAVYIDIPLDNHPALNWARSRGLKQERIFTRMTRCGFLGDHPQQIWASSGPEKG